MGPVMIYEPFTGLCTFASKPDVKGLWVVGLFFEVVVFLTVCWNVLDRPRALGLGRAGDDTVTRMLFRDGVAYFVILFVLRVANLVLAIIAPISLIFVVVFFIWATTTATTSRLIINSRRAAGEAQQRTRTQPTQRSVWMDDDADGDADSIGATDWEHSGPVLQYDDYRRDSTVGLAI